MSEKITVDYSGHVDRLGRTAFARHLLGLISRLETVDSGAVVGLEGKWGSGKTHVLRVLQALVLEQPEPERLQIIQFNPWMVSGTKNLVEALLTQLAAAVPNTQAKKGWFTTRRGQGADLAESIISYAGVLSTVKHFSPFANLLLPGAGLALEAAADAASTVSEELGHLKGPLEKLARKPEQLSIMGARLRVEDALRRSGMNFLVLVDDLDRLHPDEFAAVVQAIKAVADFPRVIYVLAYDPEVAARSIRLSLRLPDGAAYLEKIIQLPVSLPEPPASRLLEYASQRIAPLTKGLLVSTDEQSDLALVLPLVYGMLQSPREVERLRTRVQVAISMLTGKLNIADLILLEAIASTRPKMIEWIRLNVDVLMKFGLGRYDSALQARGDLGANNAFFLADEERKEQDQLRCNSWKGLLPDDTRVQKPYDAAMRFLFDNCGGVWDRPETRSQFRRVQEFRFWYRWRVYHDHHERWDVDEIAAFVSRPHLISERGLDRSRESFLELCQQVCDLGQENLRGVDAVGCAQVFANAENYFGPEGIANYGQGFGPVSALDTVLRLDSPARRVGALAALIDGSAVWLSALLLRVAFDEVGERGRRRETPEELWLVRDPSVLAPTEN